MIIYGRPINGRRILKSLFGAIVMLAVLWCGLAIAPAVDQTVIEAKR